MYKLPAPSLNTVRTSLPSTAGAIVVDEVRLVKFVAETDVP
jgi:hypothetical protein